MKTSPTLRSSPVAFLGLCLALLISLPASAQQSISAGVRAGMNLSTLYGDDVDDVEMRGHVNGGLFVTYRFSDLFALQPEVLFSQKGANVTGTALGQAGDVTYTFGYLEIPLLAKVYIPTASTLRPSIFLGPALDVKLYGEADDDDLKEQLKSTDYGIVGGLSLDYALGGFHVRQSRITLDARYMLGLSDVFDMPGDPQVRNSTFTFSLGVGL